MKPARITDLRILQLESQITKAVAATFGKYRFKSGDRPVDLESATKEWATLCASRRNRDAREEASRERFFATDG